MRKYIVNLTKRRFAALSRLPLRPSPTLDLSLFVTPFPATMLRPLVLSTSILSALALAATMQAAVVVFDGGAAGTATSLDAAANWSPDQLPTSEDEATLDNSLITLPAALTINTDQTYGALVVNSSTLASVAQPSSTTARTITLSGLGANPVATLAGGSAGDLVLLGNSVGSSVTLGGGAGTGKLGFALAADGNINVVNAGATANITGNVSGAVNLSKTGAGTLTLSGTNSFGAGRTFTLAAGTLNVNSATALGSATTTFQINGGTTINNTRGSALTMTNANPLVLNGDFTYAGGGTGTSNDLSLAAGANTLGSAAGLSRAITVTAANSTLSILGAIADGTTAIGIIKKGAGTLLLGGANTYTGKTVVESGTLSFSNATAFNTGTGVSLSSGARLNVAGSDADLSKLSVSGGGTGVVAGSFLRFTNATQAVQEAFNPGTIFGTVELNSSPGGNSPRYILDFGAGSRFTNLGSATYGGGTSSTTTSGFVSLSGDSTFESQAGTFTVRGTLTASTAGTKVLTLTGDAIGVLNQVLNGSGAIRIEKNGGGSWSVGANGSFTSTVAGGIIINQGNITAGRTATGGSTTTVALIPTIDLGDTTVNNNNAASFTLNSTNNTNSFNLETPITVREGSTNTLKITRVAASSPMNFRGGLTLNNNVTLDGASGAAQGISFTTKAISGTGKVTTDNLVSFSFANTYTGATTVNTGTLRATVQGALASTSAVAVNDGSVLQLGATGTTNVIGNVGLTLGTVGGAGNATLRSAGGSEGSGVELTSGAPVNGSTGTNTVGLGTLNVASAATLDFGSDADTSFSVYHFSAFASSGLALNVLNYANASFNALLGNSGLNLGNDRLIFSGITDGGSSLLASISFGSGRQTEVLELGTGSGVYEVGYTAIPEPATLCSALLGLGLIGYRELRRLRLPFPQK